NYHYNNPLVTTPGRTAGSIYDFRNRNTSWENIYDAYISGPLIKDKLFFFISAEADKQQTTSVQSVGLSNVYYRQYIMPKFYAKLDCNIHDNYTLTLPGVRNPQSYSASIYNYQNAPGTNSAQNSVGSSSSYDQHTKH